MPKLSKILLITDSRTPCVSIVGLDVTGPEILLWVEVEAVSVVWSFAGGGCVAVEVTRD